MTDVRPLKISQGHRAQFADGDAVPVANGGTGATTAAEARANLGVSTLPGEIRMYAGATSPAGWHICDGSALSRTTDANLFAVIETTYGAGDGSTTFNVPDLRGNTVIGAGAGYALGASGGSESVTLTEAQLPSHSHEATLDLTEVSAATDIKVGTATSGGSSMASEGCTLTSTPNAPPSSISAAIYLPSATAQTAPITLSGVTTTVTVTGTVENAPTGLGNDVSVMQPYLALNYIIKL
ncbi:MAG: phage tail protein [Methylobacter sp.]|jgi:microcystin-dependent protein